jgi:S1-C subfamily serine protease
MIPIANRHATLHAFKPAAVSQSPKPTQPAAVRPLFRGADAPDAPASDTGANAIGALKNQLSEMGDQLKALLRRVAILENRTDLPQVAARVAPATVSIVMGDGVGSGFWLHCKDGKPRIVTNAHVVTRKLRDRYGPFLGVKEQVMVHLYTDSDRQEPVKLKATIAQPARDALAVSPELDIAVLEPVDSRFKLPSGINPLELEDFDTNKPKIGDLVFKVGMGRGLPGSLSMGIVSRVSRYIDKYPSLQTDTSINPGDSGGPLVNMSGKVIGVNNSILADSDGIGFSIPAPSVKALLKSWGYLA